MNSRPFTFFLASYPVPWFKCVGQTPAHQRRSWMTPPPESCPGIHYVLSFLRTRGHTHFLLLICTHSSSPTPTHESIPRAQSQHRMHLPPSQPSQHSENPAAIWRVSDQAPDGGPGSRLCHQGLQLQLHITKASLTPRHWPLPLGSCSCCCERSSP